MTRSACILVGRRCSVRFARGLYNDGLCIQCTAERRRRNVYTFGIHYDISDRTTVALHYDWTKMKNAIATLPVLDPNSGDFLSTPINAKEDKQSINLTLDHQLNKHVTLSASYSHMKDKWKSKDGWTLGRNRDGILMILIRVSTICAPKIITH